jgi:hypothetical protein
MTQAVSMYTYINEFAKKAGNGKFPNIDRAEVVKGLKERMRSPETVNQDQASLCGPAALAYAILSHLPEMYAAYIMSLYDDGAAKLGKLMIRPSAGCRNATIGTDIPAVDWIGLASLRDSENANWEYNSPSDKFAGITMPGGMEDWFKALGFTDVREETNIVRTKGLDNFREAARLYAAGYTVCLFIWKDVLDGNRAGFFSTPNHWVVLSKYPSLTADRKVGFRVFTWGAHKLVGPMPQADFLKGYYGFLAGKWR